MAAHLQFFKSLLFRNVRISCGKPGFHMFFRLLPHISVKDVIVYIYIVDRQFLNKEDNPSYPHKALLSAELHVPFHVAHSPPL